MTIPTDEIAAVTKRLIIDGLPDGLEKASPSIKYLMTEGKKIFDGGTLVQFPIKLLPNQSQGWISGTNAIVDTTPSQQIVYGTLNLKYYNFNANFTLEDHALAAGENQVIELIASKVEGAIDDAKRDLNLAFHASSLSNPLAWEGLEDITAATGTAYAGLLDTDYTTTPDAYLSYIADDTVFNYNNITKMFIQLRARQQASGFAPKRQFGIMNPTAYQKYLGIIQGQQLAVNTSDKFMSGFEGFKINGIEYYMDYDCPGSQNGTTADNYVYLITMDTLKLYIRFGKALGAKASPFDREVQLPTSPISSVQHYIASNMVCNNRRLISVNKTFIV